MSAEPTKPDHRRIGRRSKRKGKRGELDAAKAWSAALGLPARRSRQYAGRPEAPDLDLGVAGIYGECKRREKLNVAAAIDQVAKEAGDLVPMLLHRQSRRPWLLTIRLSDLRRLVEILSSKLEEKKDECSMGLDLSGGQDAGAAGSAGHTGD